MTAWWPRCTPSKTPMARKSGPGSWLSSGIERRTCIVLSSGAAHPRNFRQGQDSPENVHRLDVLQFLHGDGSVDAEPAGLGPAQILEVRAAAERLADVERVGANVKAFAADDAEIDFRRARSAGLS